MFNTLGCQRQNTFNQNFSGDNEINMDIDVNMNNNQQMGMQSMMGGTQQPIIEPMQERVVNRTFVHQVPQV